MRSPGPLRAVAPWKKGYFYIYLYFGATLAYVRKVIFHGYQVEGFVKNNILKIKFRHRIGLY
jgi:hypothetical protein